MRDFFLPLGGGNEIGASCYLLRIGGTSILIDAGMRFRTQRNFPDFALLNEQIGGLNTLDAFLLTHAHLDHCGAITRVHYEAPHVPKFATPPTVELARVMLADALRVSQKQRAEDWSVVESSRHLLDETLDSFQRVSFQERWELGSRGCTATAIAAGHILGAASYLIEMGGKRVLCTGDICLHPQRTIPGMKIEDLSDIDVLVLESTYAYQPEDRMETIDEQYYALAQLVSENVSQGGRVLIPAFALGRAQEIATAFHDFFEEGLVEPFHVLLDGLVKAVCEVYESQKPFLQGRLKTRSGHALYGHFVRPTERAFYPTPANVSELGPVCVISSSGMLLDRTRSSAYASVMLGNREDTIAFSGYLDEESPGRMLWNLGDSDARSIRINRKQIDVRAQVQRYYLCLLYTSDAADECPAV